MRKVKSEKRKKSGMGMLTLGLALTGICSVLFYGISSSVLAMELNKTETIPTVYPVSAKEKTEITVPPANFTLLDDALIESHEAKSNELTKKEAAQTGVAMVEKLFGLDLDGAYVYMGYYEATEDFPRNSWSADIRLSDKERKPEDTSYSFSLDAVTGEFFTVSGSRTLNIKTELGMNSSLVNDTEFQNLVQKFVEDHQLLKAAVGRVEYNCQGYSSNDPDITFYVYDENGERVNITFSRYDKTFKGIEFESSIRITERMLEKMLEEEPQAIPGVSEVENVQAN